MRTNQCPQLPWQEVERAAVHMKNCFHLIRYKIHPMIPAAEVASWRLKTLICTLKTMLWGT